MPEYIGTISYSIGAVLYFVLALVLFSGRRTDPSKSLLGIACLVNVLWATIVALNNDVFLDLGWPSAATLMAEVIRDVFWLYFLVRLLADASHGYAEPKYLRIILSLALIIGAVLIARVAFLPPTLGILSLGVVIEPLLYGFLLLALGGIVLIEQLFRNTRQELKRGIKYLSLGLGSLFIYDFYLYSNTLLLQQIDLSLWYARGFINAMIVPLIGVAIARNREWSKDIFISRRIVFHTTGLLGAGLYLVAMGAGGYYVRIYGGTWGFVAQVIFLFAALLILLLLLFSGQLRARFRVFINKHFFHYKYDYREEWLRFIRTLSISAPNEDLREVAIQAIAQIIDSGGGALWLRRPRQRFEPVAKWNLEVPHGAVELANSPFISFLEGLEWVINIDEYRRTPDIYMGIKLPSWLESMQGAWLVVPLVLHEQLMGFVILGRAPARKHFNWEDFDLLKTAGRQAASHLAQLDASQELAHSQQFEAYHRLSAYIVHDIKNLAAQWSLLASNATKYKTNPQFIEDMISTVQNSVTRMDRLLRQLRSAERGAQDLQNIDVARLLTEVAKVRSHVKPAPVAITNQLQLTARVDRDRLCAVLGNLIQNAQEACAAKGQITVSLGYVNRMAEIVIEDTGVGMDDTFLRDQLFQPFYTTKGVAGMGIGAYEAREFVQSLGGEVEVTSQPNVGTRFTLRIPATQLGTKSSQQLNVKDNDGTIQSEITGH